MKYCNKCKVKVAGQLKYCPLCQKELNPLETDSMAYERDEEFYPNLYGKLSADHIILKILAFISIIIAVGSVFINMALESKNWWSLWVIILLGGAWLSLAIAISKHRNILKYLLHQSLVISILAIVFDYLTGMTGWSMTFVIPIIFTVAMIVMYVLTKVLHLQVGDYMIYLLLDALFGIIPIIFLATHRVSTDLPSLICIMGSIISVTALIIFEGKSMTSELKRRLHI